MEVPGTGREEACGGHYLTKSLDSVLLTLEGGTDREHDLVDRNTRRQTVGLTVRTTHTCVPPAGSVPRNSLLASLLLCSAITCGQQADASHSHAFKAHQSADDLHQRR